MPNNIYRLIGVFALSGILSHTIANEPNLKEFFLRYLSKLNIPANCVGESFSFKCNIPMLQFSNLIKYPSVTDFMPALKDTNIAIKASNNSIKSENSTNIIYGASFMERTRLYPAEIAILPRTLKEDLAIHKYKENIRFQDKFIFYCDDKSELVIEMDYSIKVDSDELNDIDLVDYFDEQGRHFDKFLTLGKKDISIYIKKVKILIESKTLHSIIYNRINKTITNTPTKTKQDTIDLQTYSTSITLGLGIAQASIQEKYNLPMHIKESMDKLLDNTRLFLLGERYKIGLEISFREETYIPLSAIDKLSSVVAFLDLFEFKPI